MPKYNVYDYSNQIMGEVEADDNVEAWEKAKQYENVLDVRQVLKLYYRGEDYSRWNEAKRIGYLSPPVYVTTDKNIAKEFGFVILTIDITGYKLGTDVEAQYLPKYMGKLFVIDQRVPISRVMDVISYIPEIHQLL